MALVFATNSALLRTRFPQLRSFISGPELRFHIAEAVQQVSTTTRVARAALSSVLVGVMLLSLVVLGSLVLPELYQRAVSGISEQEFTQASLEKSHQELPSESVSAAVPTPTPTPEPAFDPSLPEGTWIAIPSIGVDSQVLTTENPDEALDQGVWMVPDFGRPDQNADPIIVAAHRFGWKWWWDSDYGTKHSFYWLTETQPGDRVEIVHNQRKWVYEIYGVGEGDEITDYSGDLILYTCKFLNSPVRYFRYAKRVDTALQPLY